MAGVIDHVTNPNIEKVYPVTIR